MRWGRRRRPFERGKQTFGHRHRRRLGKVVPVSELPSGRRAIVKCVRGNCKVRQRLADLGLTPETSILIVKAAPFNGPIELAVRGSRLAIGREIAHNILVDTKGI